MNSTQKEQILNEYCDNEMSKLKHFCYPKIRRIGGISQMDYDDLYSIALDVLRDTVERYDDSQDCQFSTFLSNNIQKKFDTYVRDRNRDKRKCPGEIEYFDAPADDGCNLAEKVASDFNIEDNLSDEVGFSTDNTENWHQEVKDYLNGLSPLQREIIVMLSRDKDRDEICEMLHITYNHYENSLKRLLAYERIKPLRPLAEGKYYEVVTR